MAAYSAVVSLKQLLQQLLDSDQSSLHPQLQRFHDIIHSLQASLEAIFPAPKSNREAAITLEIEIRDAIYRAQDGVEKFISRKNASFSWQEAAEEIEPLTEKAEELADLITRKRASRIDGDVPPPPRSGQISGTFRTVGQERDKELIIERLISEEDKLQVLPITGMAGIGKTTLVRSIYDYPKIKTMFARRAWVTVSQDYHLGDILARLLNSMESRGQKAGQKVYEGSDDELKFHMHQRLYNRKYLIVIDDIWKLDILDEMKISLPDNKNGSRIIVTTRDLSIAKSVTSSHLYHEMLPLDGENSWILLCDKAFKGKPCPPQLEKIGRKIAKNCRGLPLSLTVIGGFLSQESRSEEDWRTIEEDTDAAAAKGQDAYLKILSLSYNHLPAKLKACFLYLGAFPKDSDIPLSKLSKLWIAEGFLLPSPRHETLEKVAEEHLVDLTQRNLITVSKISSNGGIKTCGVHGVFRNLAVQESGMEKFFHSIESIKQQVDEDVKIQSQRRLSVHRNVLMCYKQVYQLAESIKDTRSLLYVGPHHHHPLPFCLTFYLLRVLDAFTLYFINFPDEFLELVHLRYLSLTYNDDLPAKISQLQKLQVLMVRRQPKLIFVGVSFLPEEIWEMPELRHLWFTETDFPSLPPKFADNKSLLGNLQSLSYVNAASCTREVLRNMPSLKKLVMWVKEPGVVGLYLDELKQLEAFKFTVFNPSPKKQVEFNPELFLPPTLRKLSLSGCGLPWEAMGVIAELPDLEVLKLRELAFNGEEWCLDGDEYVFGKLKFLLLEYLNLKSWRADDSHFPCLEQLYLRHCYELEGIPSDIGYIPSLELIELVDCSRSAVEAAEEIKREQESFDNVGFQVRIYCSYE